jgi:hypothetical protein
MNQFYMSFETVPYFDINAGAPIRLTKLEMGFHWKRPTTSTLKESGCCHRFHGDERPDSRRAKRRRNRRRWPPADHRGGAFKANWADTMDHATTDITPTPVLYRYWIQFQYAVGLTLGAMRDVDDSVSPCLRIGRPWCS